MRIEHYEFGYHDTNSLPHDLGNEKKRGWIGLNGNVQSEWDLVHFVRNFLHHPYNRWGHQNQSRKVLIVTAGFNDGTEYDDAHIKEHYAKHGIPWTWSGWDNIENLGSLTEMMRFKNQNPQGHAVNEFISMMGQFINNSQILTENRNIIFKIHDFVETIRYKYPQIQLYDLYYAGADDLLENLDYYFDKIPQEQRDSRLWATLDFVKTHGDARYTLVNLYDALRKQDHLHFEYFQNCLDDFFAKYDNFEKNNHYQGVRQMLANRIHSAASVFLWGGSWVQTLNTLKFFRLEEFFQQALNNGTNFYGMSAGSIALADNIYDVQSRKSYNGYITPYIKGLGLVKNQLFFTHIHDQDYIVENDYDIISSISLKTAQPVFGLTKNSVAVIDGENNIFSVGPDPVYLFDERGFYYYLNYDQNCTRKDIF